MASAYTTQHVNWEVLWITPAGKVKRVPFGHDYVRALGVYTKAVAQGKRAVTLRSKNMPFPPPLKYADVEKVPLGRSKRTGKIVYETRRSDPPRYLVRMMTLNRRGIWWCPYCMKLRKFAKRNGMRVQGIWVEEPHYACPMCGASHKLVRRYNPIAAQLEARRGRRRSRSRRPRRGEDD